MEGGEGAGKAIEAKAWQGGKGSKMTCVTAETRKKEMQPQLVFSGHTRKGRRYFNRPRVRQGKRGRGERETSIKECLRGTLNRFD